MIQRNDYLGFLRSLPDNSVDMVFTDPPYWTLNKWRSMGTTTRLGGNQDPDKRTGWFDTINRTDIQSMMIEIKRVLRKGRHAFVMCDGQCLDSVLVNAGSLFDYYKPLVWNKVNPGMGYHLRATHEYIVMLDKGKNRICKDRTLTDIISVPSLRGKDLYPTQKPVELIDLFVTNFTEPGELVVDPFVGSGTTAVSAIKNGRLFEGCDISEEAVSLANGRIEKECALNGKNQTCLPVEESASYQ